MNLEVNILRLIRKRAKRWSAIADDVANMPENRDVVGRVLTQEEKLNLFRTASSSPSWLRHAGKYCKLLKELVGAQGLEPRTSCV